MRIPAYQTEIDSLTKRSKASENAFLSIYKVLAEAPDPYPLLEAAVVRLQFSRLTFCIPLERTEVRPDAFYNVIIGPNR